MKHTLRVLVATASLGLVAACTDTTVAPKSSVTDVTIFNDANSYKAFLARIYTGLAVSGQQGPAGNPDIQGIDEGFSQYLRLYWEHEELPTDEAVIGWGDIGLPEMNTQLWTSQSNMVVAMYYRIFFQVSLANEFLRQTTDAALTSRGASTTLKAQVKTFRAEARFLRALSYWHAIDLFGNTPLVTEADPVGATPPAQSDRTTIYNFIVSELQAIQPDLPASTAANYGRATQQAANMLLAEVYLNAAVYTGTAHYTEAMNAAAAVISSGAYSLDPNYKHLFQADNNTSPEIIFAIPQDGVHTQTWGGVTFLAHASCGGSMSNSTYGIDGCWWGLRLKSQAYNRYTVGQPAGDNRASVFYTSGQSVAVQSIGNFNDGIAAPKFQNVTSANAQGSNATFVDTDFPVFRLAEAYLIYAEAATRTSANATQALTYVNALRRRAFGCPAAGPCAADFASLTTQNILDERGRELLWEAHRRTDLVRYGLFTGGTYLWDCKGTATCASPVATDAHYDLYPLPASEIVANPNLKQNTGY